MRARIAEHRAARVTMAAARRATSSPNRTVTDMFCSPTFGPAVLRSEIGVSSQMSCDRVVDDRAVQVGPREQRIVSDSVPSFRTPRACAIACSASHRASPTLKNAASGYSLFGSPERRHYRAARRRSREPTQIASSVAAVYGVSADETARAAEFSAPTTIVAAADGLSSASAGRCWGCRRRE